jgi:hypothetical protein
MHMIRVMILPIAEQVSTGGAPDDEKISRWRVPV